MCDVPLTINENSACPKCSRKGFKWARNTCMYCGYVIDSNKDFNQKRECMKKQLSIAENELNLTLRKVRDEKNKRSAEKGNNGRF